MRDTLYRQLERPWIYALAQYILGPGAVRLITRRIARTLAELPAGGPLLDIGCGPASWLSRVGITPIGLDLQPSYIQAYVANGGVAVVASAAEQPFATDSFAGVWSIGLLHHLPDDVAQATLQEALRVCQPGGYIVIMDAVMPAPSAWFRKPAALIRRLDRGQFMRSEAQLRALLPEAVVWNCDRFTYAATGLELLTCVARL